MKVFIDFENTFLKYNLFWEKFWIFSNNNGILKAISSIFSDKIEDIEIEHLPYNPSALNTITYEYNKLDNEIVLLVNKSHNEKYAQRAISDLYAEFECRFSYEMYNPSIHSKRNFIYKSTKGELFAYIGSSIFDWNIFSSATRFNFIGNILLLPFFLLKSQNSKNYNTYFNGALFIPFSYTEIIFPLFCYCLVWYMKKSLNFPVIKISVIATVFFMSFAGLLKSLERLQIEKGFLKEGFYILCGDSFILGGSSVRIGLLYLMAYFICGLACGYYSILGMIFGMFTGYVYYKYYLLEFWPRNILVISSIVIGQILIQSLFLLKISF